MHMLGRVTRYATPVKQALQQPLTTSQSAVLTSLHHAGRSSTSASSLTHSSTTAELHHTTARSVSSFVRNALSVRRAVHTTVATANKEKGAVSASNGGFTPVTSGTDVFAQANQEVSATLNNPPPSIRSVIVRLLQNLSSKKEVDHYLKYYGGLQDGNNFAVIKIGGGLIQDELDVLVSSLSFLVDVGLLPVVIHGAGPQLNAKLEKKGIVSEYHGGIRVTTPEILQTAKQTFQEENYKLLEALENRGVRARGFQGGVFTAELLDFPKFGYVGEVKSVDVKLIREQLSKGVVPVITCMAEAVTGQLLNVNADVAAHQLAKTLKPIKIVYLSQAGGLKDQHGNLLSQIDLETHYDHLMNQEWFTKGNRLKLKEIKTLLDSLPLSSSVSITSAEQLPKELFTHQGSGTFIKRTEAIIDHPNLDNIDVSRLQNLLESSFGGRLVDGYFKELAAHFSGLYLSEQYNATAIVTKLSGMTGVDYLDKFAVDPIAQGTGTAQRLWNILRGKHPKLVWRSRKENPINSWYFEHSDGSYSAPGSSWTVFWYGLKDLDEAHKAMELVLNKPKTLDRSQPVSKSGNPNARGFSSWTNIAGSKRGFSTSTRHFSTSAARHAKKRVGLVGARGFTGGELIQLLANHPSFELVSANSRALVGQSVQSIVPELAKTSASWKDLPFGNVAPEEMAKQPVDLWVMALPNGVAKPYVDALVSAKSQAKIIDLSADYRFDSNWTYGLPESKGLRQAVAKAQYVANPGCYATAMQVALLPLLSVLAPGSTPSCFGVSGYSGAGTTPSRKNDVKELKDNLMPYALQGHIHEREVFAQLQSKGQVKLEALNFVPHVAPWFRGITMTVTAQLSKPISEAAIQELYHSYYAGEPMVRVSKDIPEVSAAAGKHGVTVSAHAAPGHNGRVVICVTLDNLLKGAATQAMQNMNIMSGFKETQSIPL